LDALQSELKMVQNVSSSDEDEKELMQKAKASVMAS
jgi:hypothetical protein